MLAKSSKILLAFIFFSVNVFILGTLSAKKVQAASYYLSPSSGNYTVGDIISASVMIDSGGQDINSGDGNVTYTTNTLEFSSISTSDSIFNIWTTTPSHNDNRISFSGGLPTPGYNGGGGKVLTISWKAKTVGTASVFINGVRILANDGLGTNLYETSSGGIFNIETPGVIPEVPSAVPVAPPTARERITISSSSHPDQNKWYQEKNITLSWSANFTTNFFQYNLNQSSVANPNSELTGAKQKTFENSSEGIWYFSIRAKKSDENFSGIFTYKIQIDYTAPNPFDITIKQEGGATNSTPVVTFEASDNLSGIDYYEAIIDDGDPIRISSGDKLPKKSPGTHTLIIKAYDKAGNIRESQASYEIVGADAPIILDITRIVGILQPIQILGKSKYTDTIIIYIDDKEVARFLVKDHVVSFDKKTQETIWKYEYKEFLMPGNHVFRFQRITEQNEESYKTEPKNVRVIASYFKLWKWNINTFWLMLTLLIAFIILIIIIVRLYIRLKRLSQRFVPNFKKSVNHLMLRLLKRTQKELEKDIDETIDEAIKKNESLREIDTELKNDIKQTFNEEKKKIIKSAENGNNQKMETNKTNVSDKNKDSGQSLNQEEDNAT